MTSQEILACLFLAVIIPQSSQSNDERDWILKILSQGTNGDKQEALLNPVKPFNLYEEQRRFLPDEEKSIFKDDSGSHFDFQNDMQKRFKFGGLLCCNHPPTKPPTPTLVMNDQKAMKRNSQQTQEEMEKLLLSKLLADASQGRTKDRRGKWTDVGNWQVFGEKGAQAQGEEWIDGAGGMANGDDPVIIRGRSGVTGLNTHPPTFEEILQQESGERALTAANYGNARRGK